MKKNNVPIPLSFLKNPIHFLGLGFGSGLGPKMPGTWGSLVAIPFILLLQLFPLWIYIVATLIVCVAGIYICGRTCEDLKVHDHSSVVWDEIAGMLITFCAIPISVYSLILGFGLFRLFDIVKPWPIRWLDRHVSGGFGVMLDDVVAAVFAWLGLQLAIYAGHLL